MAYSNVKKPPCVIVRAHTSCKCIILQHA